MSEGPANPPMEGFNEASSDQRAIALADVTMEAMGGREAWDATRYLTWNFFGAREHYWDRHTGDVRISYRDRENNAWIVLMNIHTKEGRVRRNAEELEPGEALDDALESGYRMWVNDAYWLVMPYKLKDSGVTLTYVGEDELETDGRAADIVQLTFNEVGVTPDNKYHVWIARDTGLVEKWAFFRTANQDQPMMSTPWTDWSPHGSIMLSGGRGEDRSLTDIDAPDTLPNEIFTEFGL